MSEMKIPFDHIDKTGIATTGSMMFLAGLEEKARLYRDFYYGSQTVVIEVMTELIDSANLILKDIEGRESRRLKYV